MHFATTTTIQDLKTTLYCFPKGEPDGEVPKVRAKKRQKQSFVCHLCGALVGYDSKVRHMAVSHEIYLGTKYTCETCGKVFWTKSQFNSHVRGHTAEASFIW